MTLLITEAVVVFSCFIVAAFVILPVDPLVYLLYDGGLGRIAIAVASILLALYFHDLYSQIRARSRILLLQQVMQVIGISFLFQALLFYANSDLTLPRWLMMLGGGVSLVGITGWRLVYGEVVLKAIGEEKVLLLGSTPLLAAIARHVRERPECGLEIAGYLEDGPVDELDQCALYLGPIGELKNVAARIEPDLIVVGLSERRGRTPLSELLELRFAGIRIEEAATAYERLSKRVSVNELRPSQLIYTGALGPRPAMVTLQTLYSRLIASAGLVITSPLMLLIAVAVKLSSPGPVLFRQTRVGWKGRHFTLYKFRSMYVNAEAETGAVWATKNDPRVTPVGRFLRRFRLDELPQFYNVLRGDMSLVGPRPERPEFVEWLARQIPFYPQRHAVRPGITGWAQINHKYGDTLEDAERKLEYDLYYIKNLSPSLDAYIIVQTLKTILLQRGAQ